MVNCPDGWEPINSYSLVAYVPDPMGGYMNQIRQELVPASAPSAHVTVLPPRPLLGPVEEACRALESELLHVSAFEVEATEVEIFGITSVIYVALGDGRQEFERLHVLLNAGHLHLDEPFPYHPHITLAQQLAEEQVLGVYETARVRWAEFPHRRRFTVEKVVLAQNTTRDRWIDVHACKLASVAGSGPLA